MKKVHCENCTKYDAQCHAFAKQFENSKALRVGYTTGCIGDNKNHNCKAYKRKWWKFWVK